MLGTSPRDTDGGDERERRPTGPPFTRPRERAAARTTLGLSAADGGSPPSAPAALAAAAAEVRVVRPRPDMLDSGGWKAENAEDLRCELFWRIGDLCSFPSYQPVRPVHSAQVGHQNTRYSPGRHYHTVCGYWLYWTLVLLRLLAEQRGSAVLPVWPFEFRIQSREPAALKICQRRDAQVSPGVTAEIVGIRDRGSYLLFLIPPPCSSSL